MYTNKVYLAGDMLTTGSQLLRESEKNDLQRIGVGLYVPQDNKDINDKSSANPDGLAERIVKQDSDAIYNSDVLIIEPQPFALGTMVELGQVKGRKDLANELLSIWNHDHLDNDQILQAMVETVRKAESQVVLPHYEDIRRFDGVTESEDRRSLGINQYVYGVCLDLTGGVGFYEWDEIVEILQTHYVRDDIGQGIEDDETFRKSMLPTCYEAKRLFPKLFENVEFDSLPTSQLQDAYIESAMLVESVKESKSKNSQQEAFENQLDEVIDAVQNMREEGETDMRSVLHLLNTIQV